MFLSVPWWELCSATWHFIVFSRSPSHVVSDLIYSNHKCGYRQKENKLSTGSIIMMQKSNTSSFILLLSPPKPPVSRVWMVSGWHLVVHYLSVYYYLQYQKLLGYARIKYPCMSWVCLWLKILLPILWLPLDSDSWIQDFWHYYVLLGVRYTPI